MRTISVNNQPVTPMTYVNIAVTKFNKVSVLCALPREVKLFKNMTVVGIYIYGRDQLRI